MSLSRAPRAFAAALAAVAVLTASAAAQTTATQAYGYADVRIGGGGFVSGIVYHPSEKGLAYARTDVGGAYISKGAARHWIPITDWLGRNDSLGVLSLAVDPQDAGRVYLAMGQYTQSWAPNAYLLASPDQGRTWTRANLPFKLGGNEDGRSAGERLQVDPNLGRILLLGTSDAGLWASQDSGTTWERVNSFPAASVTFVLFDAASGSRGGATPVVFVGVNTTTGPSLYRSIDAGATWSAVDGQPQALIPNHGAIDGNRVLYLTYADHLGPNGMTRGAVWKVDLASDTWSDITPLAATYFGYGGLGVDAQRPGTLVVSTMDRWWPHDELYRSVDGGATWTPLVARSRWRSQAPWIFLHRPPEGYVPHWVGDVEIDPHDSRRVTFITGAGLWETDQVTRAERDALGRDLGTITWVFANRGLEETVPLSIVSPPQGAPLLSALGDIGGFRHVDLEAYQRNRNVFDPYGSTNPSIDFAELAPEYVVRTGWGISTRGAISDDGGETWREFGSAPPPALANGPGAIAIAADASRLVWVPRGSQPYYSTDGGATWTPSIGGPIDQASYLTTYPASDRVDPLKFYVYDPVGGGLFVSTDGGASFAQQGSGLSPYAGGLLRAVPGREGEFWLPRAWNGLYRSANAGTTLERVTSVEEGYQVGFGMAAPGASDPAIFLWGRVRGTTGFFRSDDGGQTWIRINDDQHQYGWINAIIGDPRVYGRVYLATGGRGIIFGDIAGPIVEPPPPPPPPPMVFEPVYTDGLASEWQDWSWASHDLFATAHVHGGTTSLSATPGPWEAIYLAHLSGFDATGYTDLAFWIHGGDAGGQNLQVAIITPTGWYGFVGITAVAGEWQQVVLPLASLGVTASEPFITGIAIQARGEGAQTFYVDDIVLQRPGTP